MPSVKELPADPEGASVAGDGEPRHIHAVGAEDIPRIPEESQAPDLHLHQAPYEARARNDDRRARRIRAQRSGRPALDPELQLELEIPAGELAQELGANGAVGGVVPRRL